MEAPGGEKLLTRKESPIGQAWAIPRSSVRGYACTCMYRSTSALIQANPGDHWTMAATRGAGEDGRMQIKAATLFLFGWLRSMSSRGFGGGGDGLSGLDAAMGMWSQEHLRVTNHVCMDFQAQPALDALDRPNLP